MSGTGASQRLNPDERREQILAAATEVFGTLGYVAGTTDAIAKRAGISQAYVVKAFGSKENLLLAVAGRGCAKVAEVFRDAIAAFTGNETDFEKQGLLAASYHRLVRDRGLMLALMHVYTLGHDPVIGPAAREGFLLIYRIVREEAGLLPQDAITFVAHGMLIDTIMALRLPEDDDPFAKELCSGLFDLDVAGLERVKDMLGPLQDYTARR